MSEKSGTGWAVRLPQESVVGLCHADTRRLTFLVWDLEMVWLGASRGHLHDHTGPPSPGRGALSEMASWSAFFGGAAEGHQGVLEIPAR